MVFGFVQSKRAVISFVAIEERKRCKICYWKETGISVKRGISGSKGIPGSREKRDGNEWKK